MKRRNLFLSLISSVLVAIAIVTVTICTVIQPKKKADQGGQVVTPIVDVNDNKYKDMNELERDGSEEKPYVLYSAESFKDMLTRFGGQRDMYFELVRDIDFANSNYVTLFNDGESFKGIIYGNGFALKNISINVTTENLESSFSYTYNSNRYAHIGIFGKMNGSRIYDLNINALKVNVAEDVYDFIKNVEYDLPADPYAELTVGSIAGVANNVSLVKVNVDAEIAGASYVNKNVSGNNAIGGVVAIANNLKVNDSTIDVNINANSGRDYLVGGIAGYGVGVEVRNSKVAVDVVTTVTRNLDIAGLFAYARTIDVNEVDVNLTVKELADQDVRDAYVKKLTTDKDGNKVLAKFEDMSTVSGLVYFLRADNSEQKATFTNVTVTADVDYDGVYAGVIFDVFSENKGTLGLVELNNIKVDSNVNVLAAHAFARQLLATTVNYDENVNGEYFNIKLTGSVKVEKYTGIIMVYDILEEKYEEQVETYHGATILTAANTKYISCSYKDLYIEASEEIDDVLQKTIAGASIRLGAFGSYKVVG